MTDRDPLITLDRLLDDVPVRPLPDALLDQPGAGRPRRAVTVVLGAAAAVVLVVAGGVVATRLLSSGLGDPSTDAQGSLAEQTRQVGIGRVTVEVPAEWVNEEGGCLDEPGQVVYIGLVGSCSRGSGNPVGASSVTVERNHRFVDYPVVDVIAGREVRSSRIDCRPVRSGACGQYFGVPDLGVWFSLEVSTGDGGSRLMDRIRASLEILPPDLIAVPGRYPRRETTDQFALRLRSVGFVVRTVEQECADAADCAGFSTDPEPGTVVEVGSVITITGY